MHSPPSQSTGTPCRAPWQGGSCKAAAPPSQLPSNEATTLLKRGFRNSLWPEEGISSPRRGLRVLLWLSASTDTQGEVFLNSEVLLMRTAGQKTSSIQLAKGQAQGIFSREKSEFTQTHGSNTFHVFPQDLCHFPVSFICLIEVPFKIAKIKLKFA